MIEMPRRSVTRFFIPLIDVLFLMFSMFLLLPFMQPGAKASKDLKEYSREDLEKLSKSLQKQLTETQQVLAATKRAKEQMDKEAQDLRQRVLDLQPATDAAKELARLREEMRNLRRDKIQALEKMQLVRVLEIESNGKLFYLEPGFPPEKKYIKDSDDAENLVNRDKQRPEAEGRELFYLFRFSLARPGAAPQAQAERWRAWFTKRGVATGAD